MNSIIRKLQAGDLRQKGKSEEVVADVLKKPDLFRHVVEGFSNKEPGVRMRASDAVEKISRLHPEYLQPYKKNFLKIYAKIEQKEVRWHIAQILPRLKLTRLERQKVFEILIAFLEDESRIVKTFAMQGLVDIAVVDSLYKSRTLKIVKKLMVSDIPALQSRGRKLLPVITAIKVKSPALAYEKI